MSGLITDIPKSSPPPAAVKRLTLSNIAAGDLVAGRYAVISFLGRGAHGTVVLCKDQLLGGLKVALKLVPESVRSNAVSAARFSREVRAGIRVRHDNLVSIYDLVRHNQLLGYTMEALSGQTLENCLDQTKKIDQSYLLPVLMQVSQGLEALHNAEILHRDLKPANILISDHGQVKIADFGLAHFSAAETPRLRRTLFAELDANLSARLTMKGDIVGTPHYLSPEYVEFGNFDARSDLYALGVLTYELLSGTLPFNGHSIIEQLCSRVSGAPVPIKERCPEVSLEIAQLVMKLLERDPANRFQSATELSFAIRKVDTRTFRIDHLLTAEEKSKLPSLWVRASNSAQRQAANFLAAVRFGFDVTFGILVEGKHLSMISGHSAGTISRSIVRIFDFWDSVGALKLFVLCSAAAAIIGAVVISQNRGPINPENGKQAEIARAATAPPSTKQKQNKTRFFGPTQARTTIVRGLADVSDPKH